MCDSNQKISFEFFVDNLILAASESGSAEAGIMEGYYLQEELDRSDNDVEFFKQMVMEFRDDSAMHNAFDEITKVCGCADWEYPGQVVRDVIALNAEVEVWKENSILAGVECAQLREDLDKYKNIEGSVIQLLSALDDVLGEDWPDQALTPDGESVKQAWKVLNEHLNIKAADKLKN